jgi:NADPH:quinone reductase-like Zn-dependent oxidoreductase
VAYHTLVELSNIHKGQTVLIHTAAEGFGPAALQIAQYIGVNIFVTVNSKEEKDMLMENYQIPEECIFHSWNTSFAEKIMEATGHGVDVVLNTLPDGGQVASAECTAPFGHFIQARQGSLQMGQVIFDRKLVIHTFDMAFLAVTYPYRIRKVLDSISLLARGDIIQQGPATSFCSITNWKEALQNMHDQNFTGKTVISCSEHNVVKVSHAPKTVNFVATSFLIVLI